MLQDAVCGVFAVSVAVRNAVSISQAPCNGEYISS